MTDLFAESALLPDGWAENVRFNVGRDGRLAEVAANAPAQRAERLKGPVIPGMPNLHSHAFQRAMAGLAERAGPEEDSFWTWREAMYGFLDRIGPDELSAIAAQLYVEMLKAGYTAVGEFHYLHHDTQGRPYADPAELSVRVVEAALEAGIGITHLPVLYAYGNFGGVPPAPGQRRFVHRFESFLALVEALHRRYRSEPRVRIGIAPHSLRAVTPDILNRVLEELATRDPSASIHVHVAEQEREVEDCLAWSGARPVAWLLDHAPVSARWCLVHATHMTGEETRALARSGAVVGLCPTTEANLGDGLFPLPDFLAAGGAFGIGSDSHVSVSPAEELRWLEYGQRLLHRRRNIATPPGGGSVGAELYRRALSGGARALGRAIGALEAGAFADLVVLDAEQAQLLGRQGDLLLDALIFSGNANPVRDVMVAGRWVVREGRHEKEDSILARYLKAVAGLV
ncbi:MAG: formimidoylglutamate deiminase [Alphaproteobacteria bacterium]